MRRALTLVIPVLMAGGIVVADAQMPRGLPGRDSYAIRKIDPAAPCSFAEGYEKAPKTDPRVTFIEAESLVRSSVLGFDARCRQVTQQTEDDVVIYDSVRGYLMVIHGDPAFHEAVAYFAGGVTLYVTREESTFKNFVLRHVDGAWRDVTSQYLGSLQGGPSDYMIAPQYGRAIRVMTRTGDGTMTHKQWLTWDGRKFARVASSKKPPAGWRCPDSFRYFDSAERKAFCQ